MQRHVTWENKFYSKFLFYSTSQHICTVAEKKIKLLQTWSLHRLHSISSEVTLICIHPVMVLTQTVDESGLFFLMKQKRLWTLKPSSENGVFSPSRLCCALSDLSTTSQHHHAWPTSCLPPLSLTYQTRHSHTHGDGWVWPGHSARLRGVPVRKSPAAVSRAVAAVLC